MARRAATSSSAGRGPPSGPQAKTPSFTPSTSPRTKGGVTPRRVRHPTATRDPKPGRGALWRGNFRGDSTRKGLEVLEQQTAGRAEPVSRGEGGRWQRAARVVPWAAQVVVAVVLAQTLFFKFTYAPETQVIFGDRGGRPAATAVGVLELVCVVLLLVPLTAALGAALALLVIS